MRLRSRLLVPVAAGLACMPGFGWAQADALKHDPFARPTWKAPTPAAQALDNAGKGVLPEPVWQPVLTGVMLAGPKSAVNIDGTIVRIGEEINGYRLVEVREEAAVFAKNRKRVTLSLRGMETGPAAASARRDERATMERPDAPLKQDAPPQPDDRGIAQRRDDRKPAEK